ncbi:hypothetical protein BS78_09G189400 [Paspalum vaginatum]|nr:hypothetical protein BS78_09G189400 [Paspalum vaginatum]
MASARENVPLAPQPLPRQTSRPRPPPPQRPKMASGASATEPTGSGVLKCACFYLPTSRSKKKKPPPPPQATKLSSASRRSAVAPDVLEAASQSQRVTFLASASLSTWWPPSPSAAGPAPAGLGGNVAPRRASTSTSAPAPSPRNTGAPRALSSSFSHWRRPQSSRVMPHGARGSFSFPTSPASASSSCMSTPKIPQGCQQ